MKTTGFTKIVAKPALENLFMRDHRQRSHSFPLLIIFAFTLLAIVNCANAALPNLVPQSISLGASSVVAGGTLSVNWTLANIGSGSSPSTVTGVRFNQSTSSSAATATINVTMPALSANSSTPQSTTITIPANTTPGTYYVWIIADNVTSGAITQTSYTDDFQHSVSFTVTAPVQLPNLVPQSISLGASSVVAGGTLSVNWTLANIGSGSSPGTVTGVRFNQSTSSSAAAATINVSMPALSANSSTPQNSTITIPADTAPGTYYVWIIADNVTSGAITQTSYTDDFQHSVSFTVTAPVQLPNLVPQSISLGASSVVAGGTLSVNWTLANIGSGSSPGTVTGVRFNQSTSSSAAAATINVSMPALSANSSTPQNTTITIPANTTPGTYYVWIIADNVTSGAITQTSYTDDFQHSVSFTVTAPVQLPNLVPQSISLGASSVVAGGTLSVNWTLANIGSGSSPGTVTGVRLNQSSTSGNTQPYTSFANVSMPAIAGNNSTPQNTTITIPANKAPGTYYIWIIADNVASNPINQTSVSDDYARSGGFMVVGNGDACSYADDYPFSASPFCPSSTPANQCGADTIDPWNFFYRECTSYVAWKINKAHGTTTAPYFFSNTMLGGHFGNAGNWADNATAIGFTVDTTPAVGAIAQWKNGELGALGHVAYVEAVNPDGSVSVSEYNNLSGHNYDVRCSNVRPPRFIHIGNLGALPNLIPQNVALSSSSIEAGSTLTVSWSMANNGDGDSPSTVTGVRLNQSSISGNTQPYTSFANVSMPAISAHSSTPQSTTITMPPNASPGTYYVWLIADNVTISPINQTSVLDDYAHSSAFSITSQQLPGTVLYGIDVSHFQNEAGTIDWPTVFSTGQKRFAFIKASESYDVQDNYFFANMAGATGAGLSASAYHLLRPDFPKYVGNISASATAEAQYFLSRASSYIGSGYLPPTLDLEGNYGLAPSQFSQWVRTWLQYVKQQTGVTPIIYATRSIARDYLESDLNSYPLWISTDDSDPTGIPSYLGTTWPGWMFKQYLYGEHGGTCAGVTGPVDLDSFNGDATALQTLCSQILSAVAQPTIIPSGGVFSGSVQVSIACDTAGSTICYTTDGSEPTGSSTVYLAPLTVSGSTIVRAKAFLPGFNESSVTPASFSVSGVVAQAPTINNVQLNGSVFTLSVPTQIGFNYVLEYKDTLNDSTWSSVQTNSGDGTIITLTNVGVSTPSRLYRVRVQ